MDDGQFAQPVMIGSFKKGIGTRKKIAVAGGKGGVGKTTIATLLGMSLAACGKQTIVVDLDLGGANLHQAMGILTPTQTIRDFLYGSGEIQDFVLPTSIPKLGILAGLPGSLGMANLSFELKKKAINHLNHLNAEFIILDIGAGAAFNQLDYFLAGDVNLLVINPDCLAIQDGFNFIKTAFLRRLYKIIRKDPNIRTLFKPFFLLSRRNSPVRIDEITEKLKNTNHPLYEKWTAVFKTFKPIIIVNKLESQQDLKECRALLIAARELLGIELEHIIHVSYNKHIDYAMKTMNASVLLENDGRALTDMQKILKLVSNDNGQLLNEKKTICAHGNGAADYSNTLPLELICSIKCGLWGNCSMQIGGYPCRIKIIGHANQRVNP